MAIGCIVMFMEPVVERTMTNLPSLEKSFDFWNEMGWPIGSLMVMLRPLHHWLIGNVAKIKRGQKVLEIGAGYPLYKLYADKVGRDGLFATVDINNNIQGRAKKICYWIDGFFEKKSRSDRIVHSTADATKLPFGDNTFDTIIASNFTGGDDNVREALRALKPGGRVIYTWDEFLSIPILTAIQAQKCKELGFEKVKIRPGAPGSIVPGQAWNWYMEASKPVRQEKLGSILPEK